jgi:hypothetical protein
MKKIIASFLFFFACVSTLVSQTGFESLNYLYSISGKSTLAGQKGRAYWKIMKRITGDYPALWGEDFLFQAGDGSSSLSEWRSLMTHDAKQRWAQGVLITLMFNACPPTVAEPCDWWNDVLGGSGDGGSNTFTAQQWTDLITDGTTLNNNWKARLDVICPYLKELQDAGVEVLFRPIHEMNQSAYWWGGRPGANGTSKLYQITHDYLVKMKGLTNLIWVWNLQDFPTLSSDLNDYDPGSDYWDILALDVYWTDGTGYTSTKYNLIKNKAEGKPIAIAECDVLPASSLLLSQPDWSYFMGWAELTQQNNSDATIRSIYNSAHVLTLGQTGRETVLYNDSLMLCNFDDLFPFISTSGNLTVSYTDAPVGSPVSGKMGVVQVPANNTSNFFAIWDDQDPFDPRDYVGISFLAQAQVSSPVPFALQLEQSIVSNNIAQIQDWTYNWNYAENGAWQEVHIGFDAIKTSLTNKLATGNHSFDASNYDRITIVPAHYQTRPAFTLNIDNIRLRKSWDDTGILPTKKIAESINIIASNGTISAKATSGAPVALKVYSISGQEVAKGTNQVQFTIKGVCIVKATAGDLNQVSKVAVN